MIGMKLYEFQITNRWLRIMKNYIYRFLFAREERKFGEYLRENKSKDLIAINLYHAHFFEHIKDLVEEIELKGEVVPLFIGHTKWPPKKHKKNTFYFLSSKYNLNYNENLFAYPWLKYSGVKIFIDFSFSTYDIELKCPKILYTHGMAGLNFSKFLDQVRFIEKYSMLFLNGPIHKKALVSAQERYGGKLPPMYEVGYLRGDRLLRMAKSFDKKNFLKKIELPKVPVILYAPTWGNFSSPMRWLDLIVEVCKGMGVNLLIRLHPKMVSKTRTNFNVEMKWEEKLQTIEKENPCVKVVFNQDIDDVMLSADVMITDVSGMALEFMAIDKPVVFLESKKYFELFGDNRPEKWCRPTQEVRTKSDLEKELKKAIDGNGFKYPAEELMYNIGHSLEIMMGLIESIIHKEID